LVPVRILILADRDWTHPEAGGTGTTLRALVDRWIEAGTEVTMIAGAYEGCDPLERPHPRLEIHRMGTRLSVFPKAAAAVRRGTGRDADVVFEVVNGIAFFTPLWWFLRAPKLAFIQHVHQDHYVLELGWRGRVGAFMLERLPLRRLYRRIPFCTISQAARDDLVRLGVPDESIDVVYLGVDEASGDYARTPNPTILYLGRLKRYKRLEMLLDVLELLPDATLDVVGDGDYQAAFEAEVQRRGLGERVLMHGFVPEPLKSAFYKRAWVMVTTSSAEGWGLTVMEAAACGTPSAALRVGGLNEAIVDGETGALADSPAELAVRVGEILASPELRERLGSAAAARAQTFSWDHAAVQLMTLLEATAAPSRDVGRDDEPPEAQRLSPEPARSGSSSSR
jgi:glycosyltransferase involved in cell wall biosynthesis